MHIQTPVHRHLVAAPLCAFLMLILIADGPRSVSSQDFMANRTEHAEWETFTLASGVRGMVYEGGELETSEDAFRLLGGSMLLEGEGLIELRVSRFVVRGLAGAFHVSLNGDALSVAAITSPVLVIDGEQRMLIPVGLQWRTDGAPLPNLDAGYALWSSARSLQWLPTRFLRTQLQHLILLPILESTNLPLVRTSSPSPFQPSSLLFAAAEGRHKERWIEHVLGSLRSHLKEGDEVSAAALLRDSAFADAFASSRGAGVLAVLLSSLPRESRLQASMLPYILENEDFWLLASVHPLFRSHAWTLPAPQAAAESTQLRLLALPQSDVLGENLSDFTVQRWVQAVRALEDPVPFLEELIAVVVPSIERAEERGYPERARRLAGALEDVCDGHETDLSAASLRLLSRLEDLDRVDIAIEPVIVKEVAEALTEEPVVDGSLHVQEVEARAYQLLKEVSGMFTVHTTVSTVSADTAHVASIVFGSTSGDRAFDFDLNVVREEVSNIVLEGERFPYDLSLEAFVEWVRQ